MSGVLPMLLLLPWRATGLLQTVPASAVPVQSAMVGARLVGMWVWMGLPQQLHTRLALPLPLLLFGHCAPGDPNPAPGLVWEGPGDVWLVTMWLE